METHSGWVSVRFMLAAAEDIDVMVSALDGHGGRLEPHRLPPEAARALTAAVAGSPGRFPHG
jgi:hypothetical protein